MLCHGGSQKSYKLISVTGKVILKCADINLCTRDHDLACALVTEIHKVPLSQKYFNLFLPVNKNVG